MYQEQRHQQILEQVREQGRVSVAELAPRFTVSAETVRRDLDMLARRNLLVRVHGGAVLSELALEPDLQSKSTENLVQKTAIGHLAAEIVAQRSPAGLIVDAGTTTKEVVAQLKSPGTLILTNSIPIAQASLDQELATQILPGSVRPLTHAAVGGATTSAISQLNPEVALLGCNGISEVGFTTADPEEAAVKAALVAQADYKIMVADASKAGHRQLVTFASPGQIDLLITDEKFPKHLAHLLEQDGIEVIYA